MASLQLVIFRIDDEMFGINIDQVKEIINPMEIFKVPDTPNYFEGLINLRGKIYTIINLRKKFNISVNSDNQYNKIVIMNSETLAIGFIIDVVQEIVWVEDKFIERTPESIRTLNRDYISGIAKINDKAVMLLDLEKVLGFNNSENLSPAL